MHFGDSGQHPTGYRQEEACPVAASVVVLSYNSARTIRKSLDSLSAQQTTFPYEVIVVDSSNDETARVVAAEYSWVRLVKLSRRSFPGQTRNIGIQHARGEIIAFLASDCIADPNWLQARVDAHREGFAAVGGIITNANPDSAIGWANYLLEYVFSLPNRPRELIKGKIIHNLSYDIELFRSYGLFPPDLPLGEDTVFNRKLMLKDVPVLFEPAVKTGHINPTSIIALVGHHYGHGKYFMRACRNGDLKYFKQTSAIGPRIIFQTLVTYPWMRLRNCIRFVFGRNRKLIGPLLVSFPGLVAGAYACALGAMAEAVRLERVAKVQNQTASGAASRRHTSG